MSGKNAGLYAVLIESTHELTERVLILKKLRRVAMSLARVSARAYLNSLNAKLRKYGKRLVKSLIAIAVSKN